MIPILILLSLGSLGVSALSKISLVIIYLSLSLGFSGLLLLLMFIGGLDIGQDGHGDISHHTADSTISDSTSHVAEHGIFDNLFILSPTAFLTSGALFGAYGLITLPFLSFLPNNIRDYSSIILSMFLTFFTYFSLIKILFKFLRTSGLAKSKYAFEGKEGDIVESISENGVGKIAVKIDNEVHYLYCRTEDGRPIPIGRKVKIKKILGDYAYVEES